MKDRVAVVLVVCLLVSVPSMVLWYEHGFRPDRSAGGMRVIELTGVASSGTWTMESVSNINYWWKQFTPATIQLEQGETVLLRFRSADVYHQFYVPALNFGPVTVMPGEIQEVELQATRPGAFQYFCTYMCGNCHFYMRGWVVITAPGEVPVQPDPLLCPICLPDFGDPPRDDRLALGSYLYLSMGCSTCHGLEGVGGVDNYNYINDEIPAHNNTVEKFFLQTEEDAETLMAAIQRGKPVDEESDAAEISNFPIVKARFAAAGDLIRRGKNAAPLDMEGPTPPLQMPSWKYKISDGEIDAILGYFISLYDWEEEI